MIQEWVCNLEFLLDNGDDDISYNHSDAQTKPLPYGEKRVKFCKQVLKHIYGFDEHVKNAAVTDVTEQGEHERPAAALWTYNYVGTSITYTNQYTIMLYSWLEESV